MPDDVPPVPGDPVTKPPGSEAAMRCPRCGHDLRGAAAESESAVCAECGLTFAWEDLWTGRLALPRWSSEGAMSIKEWLRRLGPQVFMATIRPRAMLGRLRLEHRIGWIRLLAVPVVLIALMPVLLAAWVTGVQVLDGVPVATAAGAAVRPTDFFDVEWSDRVPGVAPGEVVVWQGPGPLLTAPADRYGATSIRIPARLPAPIVIGQIGEASLVTERGVTVIIDPGLQWSPRWLGSGGGRFAPMVLTQAMVDQIRLEGRIPRYAISPSERYEMMLEPLAASLVFVLPIVLALPVSLVCIVVLPIARRRARVRLSQLGRLGLLSIVTGLGLVFLASAVALATGSSPNLERFGKRFDRLGRLLGLGLREGELIATLIVLFVVPLVVAGLWWTWAAGRYLRMASPAAVGFSIAGIGVFIGPMLLGAIVGILSALAV